MRVFLAALALSLPVAAQTTNEDFKLNSSDATRFDNFGRSVAISAGIGIIGTPGDDDRGIESGSVFLFDVKSGQFRDKLSAPDGEARFLFGTSVAISGFHALVGAPGSSDAGFCSGSAYIFDASFGSAPLKLTASDAAEAASFGESVAISGTTAIVGAPVADGQGNIASGAAYIFDATSGQQLFKLTASDAALNDRFGASVAISGTTAIVGAFGNDDAGGGSGAAYIFDTTTGQQLFKLTANDAGAGDSFGFSVAISGNTVIVGAPFANDELTGRLGYAYIFDATTGQQLFRLTAADAAPGDEFGYAVSIEGTLACVGAEYDDDAGSRSGSTYVFDTTNGSQLFKITASDADQSDEFGNAVSISDNTILVGAIGDSTRAGAAYAYDTATGQERYKLTGADAAPTRNFGASVGISRTNTIVGSRNRNAYPPSSRFAAIFDTTTGQERFKLQASDSEPGDDFGSAVAISGSTAIVGAREALSGTSPTGAAYLFDLSQGFSQQTYKLTPSDALAGDRFGGSVAITGTTALVGAVGGVIPLAGAVYIFDTTTAEELFKLTASDTKSMDQFGLAIAISGTTAVIGAPANDDDGFNSGAAYIFDTTSGQELFKLTTSDAVAFDRFGSTVAISGTTAVIAAPGPNSSVYVFDTSTGQQLLKINQPKGANGFGRSVAILDETRVLVSDFGSTYLMDMTTGELLSLLLPSIPSQIDQFGVSVAADNGTAVIGSARDMQTIESSGSAYLFKIFEPTPCPGDVNFDGTTDLADLNTILANFGFPTSTGDTNNDDTVDLADLNAVLAAFGTTCP